MTAAWVAFALITLLVVRQPAGTALDLSLGASFFEATMTHPRIAEAGRVLDVIGGDVVAVLTVLIVCLMLYAKRHRLLAGFQLVSALGGVALCTIVKVIVDRPRPPSVGLLLHESTPSYPSGHATSSITVFVGLGIVSLVSLRSPWRWVMALPLFILGPLIGVSRVAMGVHWPTDVLGGWALGCAWTATVALFVVRAARASTDEAGIEPVEFAG